jgi:hypothetical protein
MNKAGIEDIAYLLEQAKKHNQPKPIVFLGAGASLSGGIPLTGEIMKDILASYSDNPRIQKLPEADRTYANLMGCLLPAERNKLLKSYIDKAKINVSHIYLAQLITQGYIDYVLTVNFDNLMLRALALFNYYPPTYDLAILKDLTTTSFPERSVLYLHGQHHGLWLLNTAEEMAKVQEIMPPILNKITNGRAWIVVGYSGIDPLFNHIVKLGNFDNGLFWIGYMNEMPTATVRKELLDKPNTNAALVENYDSDSFFLALSSKLEGLQQPLIFDKPFSFLQKVIENIVDIEGKDHFKGVKERLEIVKSQVSKAISQFDKGETTAPEGLKADFETDQLKKEIINKIIQKDYGNIAELEAKVNALQDPQLNESLSNLYSGWGLGLNETANTRTGAEQEALLKESFEKYARATALNPKTDTAFYNWGIAIHDLAKTKTDDEQEKLLQDCFEKYAQAVSLNPKFDAYNNWGIAIHELATIKKGAEKEKLLRESMEKYAEATKLNPKFDAAFYNWGLVLRDLAKIKTDEEQEALFEESFGKFAQAIALNPKSYAAYTNWGLALQDLANTKTGEEREKLFEESFEKYAKAASLNPKFEATFTNWGLAFHDLGKTHTGEEMEKLFRQSFAKYEQATTINPKEDDAFYNWGIALYDLSRTKSDPEKEKLLQESCKKYAEATKLNPKNVSAYENWAAAISDLAKSKTGPEKEALLLEAGQKLLEAKTLGGNVYNLACLYALQGKSHEALELLEEAFKNKHVKADYVLQDEDWKNYREDPEFKRITAFYS